MRRLSNLKQNSAGLQVSDLKANKVNVIDVVLGFTEVPCNMADKRGRQGKHYSHMASNKTQTGACTELI